MNNENKITIDSIKNFLIRMKNEIITNYNYYSGLTDEETEEEFKEKAENFIKELEEKNDIELFDNKNFFEDEENDEEELEPDYYENFI